MTLTRRALAMALPLVPSAARAAPLSRGEAAVHGSKAYSESSMVMAVSPDGRSALTLRFCRYPDEDALWLWCHVVRDGVMYAYTNHDLPCDTTRLAGTPQATYRAAGASLARDGSGAGLKSVRIAAELMAHKGRKAPHGAGRVPVKIAGEFKATDFLDAKVLAGRDEMYGRFVGEVTVAGVTQSIDGPSKFHEQRQEQARFEAPFNYAWLAGEGIAGTTLMGAKGASGGFQIGEREDAVKGMKLDPPGDRRKVEYLLEKAGPTPGRLEAIVRYQIPIYGRTWRGSFVRGQVGERAVVGVSNDWINGPSIYGAGA